MTTKKIFSMETRFSTDCQSSGKPSVSPEVNHWINWLHNNIIRLERQRDRALQSRSFYRAGFWGLVILFLAFVLGAVMEVW